MRTTIKKGRRGILYLPVLFLLLSGVVAWAQKTATVSGTVLTDKGEGLQGVTISAANKTGNARRIVSAVTNDKGVFTFNQLKVGDVYDLTFSSVGYKTFDRKGFVVKQAGESNSLLIRLKSKSDDLNEVVVTALGIKREERTLKR